MARRKAPRGTEDILPDRVPIYDRLYRLSREVLERHGYAEIRTPLFEETSLFVRSLGEQSDVVEKEMFTVARGDTSVTFRPEGTAGVARAYLEHNLDKVRPFQKLYYLGPMFRFERPQAGRQRQFDQIGIEALGSASPLLDVEAVAVAHRCFEAAGVRNYTVHLNSLGDRQDRARYREVLKEYMAAHLDARCEDCRRRFEHNVLRMLDCKVQGCQPTNREAPRMLDHLREESRARFERVVAMLERLQVPCAVDPRIVRGLDYYTHTVFEVRCPDLGARDAICGGGRYDDLIADLGGPALGAVGFAIGVTSTLLALEVQQHPAAAASPPSLPIFVAPVSDAERDEAFLLADRLRREGLACDTDYEDKSLKALFRGADKRGVRLMLVLGADELRQGTVKVKDFATGEELALPDGAGLATALRSRLAGAG